MDGAVDGLGIADGLDAGSDADGVDEHAATITKLATMMPAERTE